MNITSLYNNFPHTKGLLAWKYLPTKFIVDMGELVLRNNFRGHIHGCHYGPDHGNLDYLEDRYIWILTLLLKFSFCLKDTFMFVL